MRIARNKQIMFEFVELLEGFPSFEHCRTCIRCDTVDSIKTAIAKLREVVLNPVCNMDSGHLSSTDVFRAPMKGTRRGMNGNIDDASIVNIGAFICDDVNLVA